MQAAIFLDRDNTLIHNDGDLGDPARVKLIQGAAVAIGSLRGLGYKIIVVTNQGGVARGKYEEVDVDAVHQRINELVRATASGSSIDRFYYCPFHPEGTVEKYRREHPWRKPQPGMLLQAAKDMNLDLGQSWMIGDQMRDVEAGAAAGTRTVLIRPPGGSAAGATGQVGQDASEVRPSFTAGTLIEAVRIIAQQRKPEVAQEIRSEETGPRRWDNPSTVQARDADAATKASASTNRRTPSQGGDPDQKAEPGAETMSAPRSDPPQVRAATAAFKPWGTGTTGATKPSSSQATQEFDSAASITRARAATGDQIVAGDTQADAGEPSAVASQSRNAHASILQTPDLAPAPKVEPPASAATSEAAKPVAKSTGQKSDRNNATATEVASDEATEPSAAESSSSNLSSSRSPSRLDLAGEAESDPAASMHVTLRQMLQELRNQRSNVHEFSILSYLAIVLQVIAALCLLAALLLGPHVPDDFYKWLGTGLFIQLAVIAVLLFDR